MKAKLIRDNLKGKMGSRIDERPDLLALTLVAKLHEEAQEIAEDISDPKEYADMFEAIYQLMELGGVSNIEVQKIRAIKSRDRGGFSLGKIMLVPSNPQKEKI